MTPTIAQLRDAFPELQSDERAEMLLRVIRAAVAEGPEGAARATMHVYGSSGDWDKAMVRDGFDSEGCPDCRRVLILPPEGKL